MSGRHGPAAASRRLLAQRRIYPRWCSGRAGEGTAEPCFVVGRLQRAPPPARVRRPSASAHPLQEATSTELDELLAGARMRACIPPLPEKAKGNAPTCPCCPNRWCWPRVRLGSLNPGRAPRDVRPCLDRSRAPFPACMTRSGVCRGPHPPRSARKRSNANHRQLLGWHGHRACATIGIESDAPA